MNGHSHLRQRLGRAVAAMVLCATALLASAQTVTYFHNDLSGTPVLATDAVGNVVWKENYRPYGDRLNNPPAGSGNAIGFAGKPFDAATGLSYMGARYYDPGLGRFMGVDPAPADPASVHGINRYAYANNNPYKYVDPDGHNAVDIVFFAWDIGKLAVALYSGTGVGSAFGDVVLSAVGVISPIPFAMQAVKNARAADRGVEAVSAGVAAKRGVEAAKGVTQAGTSALPKGITQVKNAKGEVFKEVHTPPSRPHAGMAEHTHPNYRNVLPDGSVRTGVSKDAVPVSRRDIVDATRPGAQRTGVPE